MHHSRSSGSRIREQSPHGRCPAFSGFPNDRLSPTGSGLNAHSDGYPRGAARLPRGIIPVPLFTRMPDGVAPRRCVHTVSASRIFSSCRTDFVRTTLIIDHAGAPVKHRNPYFLANAKTHLGTGLTKKSALVILRAMEASSASAAVWAAGEDREPGENPGRYRRCMRGGRVQGESRSLGNPEKARAAVEA